MPTTKVEEMRLSLLRLGAATLGESGARAMAPRIKPAWLGASIAGLAYPIQCAPGDNLAIHVGVACAPGDSVLVASVGEIRERGYWGEVLTTAAEARNIAGLVIDGGVRDSSALQAHRFPVFSTTLALKGATKEQSGTCGAPIEVGDVLVEKGDWIVADSDGVVVVPKNSIEEVLEAGCAREKKEDKFFAQLQDGSTTAELLDLDSAKITVS